MVSIVTDDVLLVEEKPGFEWSAVAAGAVVAASAAFFLVLVGAGLGLTLAGTRNPVGAHSFLTIGAIYFLAAQAFGFAAGGYVTGRLMARAPESENEHFRADVHGLGMWGLTILAGLLFAGLAVTAGISKAAPDTTTPMTTWADKLLAGAPAAGYEARAGQVSRLLAMDVLHPEGTPNEDRRQLTILVAGQNGISDSEATVRIENVESRIRDEADIARKAALYLVLWTAIALLFGGFVAIAATVAARFHTSDFQPFRKR